MIKLSNLNKSYEEKVIFKNLNLHIKQGEKVVIIGKSGAGKSTLLNLLSSLDDNYEGNIYINGVCNPAKDKKLQRRLLREDISYVFQNYGLIDEDSIFDNLKIGLKFSKLSQSEIRNNIQGVISTVGLSKDITPDTKIYQLSGGEQQRVAVARALLRNTPILFADEPTGNLDEDTSNDIVRLLLDSENTLVLVTHDLALTPLFDRTLTLERGGLHE